MPRPKGSKNKAKTIENVDEKIAAVEAEIEKLNAELKAKGYLTISGRVNRRFFLEKYCYGGKGDRDT